MEGAPVKGVLSQLSLLEVQARSRKTQSQQSRVKELKAQVEALITRRERLRADIQTHKEVQKWRSRMEKQCEGGEDEEMDEDSDNASLLQLMAKQTQLTDILLAHQLIGGYNIVQTHQGKGVCVSLPTAYEGAYLDTYNLEISLKPTLKISRHNIPPFIPLNSLAEQSNMQTDLRGFLDTLSQHLNAFVCRKQQFKLVQELHKSVLVMESNMLCSRLVLMFTLLREEPVILCTLHYMDHTRWLPTQVTFECKDKDIPDSPAWKRNYSLLMETPVHKALSTMKQIGNIA